MFGSADKNLDEMVLECLDGSFGDVAAMVVRWGELVVNPFGFQVGLETSWCFVVESLEYQCDAAFHELFVEHIVCSRVFNFGAVGHGLCEYGIGIKIIPDQYVLIAFAGRDGQAAG